MWLIDTHCHLTSHRFDADRAAVLDGFAAEELWRAITIGTGVADGQQALALAKAHPEHLACTVGLDPYTCHEAGDGFATQLAAMEALLRRGGFCALGEIGIEYHHEVNARLVQMDQFSAQLDLARSLDLPVVIHIREGGTQGGADAHADALAVMQAHPGRGVVHSFAGNRDHARTYLDLGYHLAFNGMVTYPRNEALRQAAALVPNDRLLVETDSPYLPPQSHRGRRNEPARVRSIAQALADLRGEREDDLAAWTTKNACELFSLPRPW